MSLLRRGFTLIELLVVMAIVGILVGLLLPAVQSIRETARRTNCLNNCRQIGLAMQSFENSNKHLPTGWISEDPVDRPGWGWASYILPYIEMNNLHKDVDYQVQFSLPPMENTRTTIIDVFLCPSDTAPLISQLDYIPEDVDPDDPPPLPFFHPIPDKTIQLLVAKSNYSGVFGSTKIQSNPSAGNGVFFRNSKIRFKEISDGLSTTLLVGERRGDLGTITWVGVEPEVEQAAARIVAVADHTPNHPDGVFEDFRSAHGIGVHFVSGDGSTRLISNTINPRIYKGLATRSGGEVVRYDE